MVTSATTSGSEKPTEVVTQTGPALELSVLMPCLNEAETLASCVTKAQQFLERYDIAGEIIVADNGSTDGSQAIAAGLGARVVPVPTKGYGSALLGGIAAARGTYIIMGDADSSYDFGALLTFVQKLREGFDLVMGNRFQGGVLPGAMPALHRHLGNPVLSAIGQLFFRSPIGDFHCGLRGFTREAVTRMDLRTTGMEFASEMVVKATLFGMRVTEVPTILAPDGRSRRPHLRTWRDGWRHLRFMLLYSPMWLFFYPGLLMMLAGLLLGAWLLPGPRAVGPVTLDVHTLLYSAAFVLIGFDAILFAVFSKIFAISEGLLPAHARLDRVFQFVTLETGLATGALLIVLGLAVSFVMVGGWGLSSFGALDPVHTLRLVIPAVLSLTLGCQIVLASFFLSVLGMHRRAPAGIRGVQE